MELQQFIPDEIWIGIMSKVDNVRDMSRLALVSRQLNRLITNAVTQVRTLELGGRWIFLKTRNTLCAEKTARQQRIIELTRVNSKKAFQLIEKMVAEANNLKTIVFDFTNMMDPDEPIFSLFIRCVHTLAVSQALKPKYFHLEWDNPDYTRPLPAANTLLSAAGGFLASKANSLECLSFDIDDRRNLLPPPFPAALGACTELKTVKMHLHHMEEEQVQLILSPALTGLYQLKSLHLFTTPLPGHIATTDTLSSQNLQTMRHLQCHLKTVSEYIRRRQTPAPAHDGLTMGHHTLRNVETLNISLRSLDEDTPMPSPTRLATFPFLDFPQLDCIRIDAVFAADITAMISAFLNQSACQPSSPRTVHIHATNVFVCADNWRRPPPTDAQALAEEVQNNANCYEITPTRDATRLKRNFSLRNGTADITFSLDHLQ